jgi:hypothetical protein
VRRSVARKARALLEHGPDVAQVDDLVGVEVGHDVAAARPQDGEAVGLQTGQRLADGQPADGEAAGDLLLAERRPGRQGPGQDFRLERRVGEIRQARDRARCEGQRRWLGHSSSLEYCIQSYRLSRIPFP